MTNARSAVPQSLASLPEEALSWDEFLAVVAGILGLPREKAPEAVLNASLAEAALAAPHAGFGGTALHPDPVDRAIMLAVSICRNHSLVDGNKRVALIGTTIQLARRELQLTGSQDELAATVEALAAGALDQDAFVEWVHQHLRPRAEMAPTADRAPEFEHVLAAVLGENRVALDLLA
jgi:death-on-curing protein